MGFAGGRIPQAALNHALVKNYGILGLHWGLYRSRDPALVRRAHAGITDLVRTGAVRPLVAGRLAPDEAATGLTRLAEGSVIGRLTVSAA